MTYHELQAPRDCQFYPLSSLMFILPQTAVTELRQDNLLTSGREKGHGEPESSYKA